MTIDDIDGETTEPEQIDELPIRSEDIGFATDAMLPCKKCGRQNAPNRAACIYCGGEIVGSTAESKLDLRELESWENGFNVVVIGTDTDAAIPKAASILSLNPDSIQPIITSGKSIPLARVESETQAEKIVERLSAEGVRCRVVPDEALSPTTPQVRLRGIRFGDGEIELTHFGKATIDVLRVGDLALIVHGVVYQGKTESIEKRKRRSTETLSETQTSTDESVIDIYSRNDPTGWRIPVSGFDFSCLGAEKSLFAGDNIERLLTRLSEFAPDAKVVGDYTSVHTMLELTWPSESRKDNLGTQRTGFAKRTSPIIFSTNNILQLSKYSRLQWHLL